MPMNINSMAYMMNKQNAMNYPQDMSRMQKFTVPSQPNMQMPAAGMKSDMDMVQQPRMNGNACSLYLSHV